MNNWRAGSSGVAYEESETELWPEAKKHCSWKRRRHRLFRNPAVFSLAANPPANSSGCHGHEFEKARLLLFREVLSSAVCRKRRNESRDTLNKNLRCCCFPLRRPAKSRSKKSSAAKGPNRNARQNASKELATFNLGSIPWKQVERYPSQLACFCLLMKSTNYLRR